MNKTLRSLCDQLSPVRAAGLFSTKIQTTNDEKCSKCYIPTQVGEDCPDDVDFKELSEVTWCWHRVFNTDIEFVLNKPDVSGRSEQLKGEYTAHFIEWRDKYFDENIKVLHYKSKSNGNRYSVDELHKKYSKAMKREPFNCH